MDQQHPVPVLMLTAQQMRPVLPRRAAVTPDTHKLLDYVQVQSITTDNLKKYFVCVVHDKVVISRYIKVTKKC